MLVVLASEVGGRWSQESRQFLIALASIPAPVESESGLPRCTAAKSFASSLLDGSEAGVDGSTPSLDEVLVERRFVPRLATVVAEDGTLVTDFVAEFT